MAAEAPGTGRSDVAAHPRISGWRRIMASHRARIAARYAFGIGMFLLVLWVLSSHRDELSGFSTVIADLRWWWVPPAVLAEFASFVCFAYLQSNLLGAAGLDAPWSPLLKMTFANQAIANSVPGGSAASTVYGFRWFRRFGADDTLATWAMVGTFVASTVTLATVAMAGLALAAGEGASLDLVPVIVGVFLITLGISALFVYERPLAGAVTWGVKVSRSVTGRPRGDIDVLIKKIVTWVTKVHLNWRQIAGVFWWGAANWLFDCACFAMMFPAVGAAIPWKGLLLAYGAGQLAATLPITPGGLGVVEGSITIALVAFGGVKSSTVDAVLMYRFISFWLILVVGWALWGELALQVRRGRWSRQALSTRVQAGLEANLPPADRKGDGTVVPSGAMSS